MNEEVLFELSVTSFAMSYTLDYPVLIYGIGDNKLHIGKGYPDWEYWTHPIDCSTWYEFGGYCWMEEREKNWKAIEPGWNKFIEQLKKEGLYRE
ncbi:MAG: hypothetical protein LBJ47_10575 [Tannerella sp.]|nr:hypothetical protein [Tannerella sp.]